MFDIKGYILIFLTAFIICTALTAALIPMLKKLRAGQYILSYVPEHKEKSGTPTMGGLAFICAAIISALIFTGISDKEINLCLAAGFSYMVVGFLDDFIKVRFRNNKGLLAYQKLIFQFSIAIITALFAYFNQMTEIYLPIADIVLDLKFWYVPIAVLLFVYITNSVNLTDGLDGLAGGVSLFYFFALGIIILLEKTLFYSNTAYSYLCFALCGSLSAYLIFNTNKAVLFMGDTGSLALGAFAASVGILSGNMLFIPLLGIMYVVSGISVILQVLYFKKTGRRIFLMAPLHHHFQHKGFSEAKISYIYTLITALAALVCILSLV